MVFDKIYWNIEIIGPVVDLSRTEGVILLWPMDLTPPTRLSDSLEFLNDPTVRDKILENLSELFPQTKNTYKEFYHTPPPQ